MKVKMYVQLNINIKVDYRAIANYYNISKNKNIKKYINCTDKNYA